MTEGGAGKDAEDGEKPRRPMNAVGLVTADKVKQRAANAAHTAFEAWQVRPLKKGSLQGAPLHFKCLRLLDRAT